MHFQAPPHEEAKLVRCTRGAVYDVIVDLRPESQTFRAWHAETLTAENRRALYVPHGVAHGFQTLEDASEVLYLIDAPTSPRPRAACAGTTRRSASSGPTRPSGSSPSATAAGLRGVRRALVTGAGGFIGRQALAALLERGFEVHAADVADAPGGAPEGVSWHRADLLDEADARAVLDEVAPTHLLHLAWYAVPGSFWSSPENRRWARASIGLLRSFAGRAVTAGSCAEYDWSAAEPLHEGSTPLQPRSLYGVCKQEVGAVAAELGHAHGRVFFLYGPGEHPDRLVSSVTRRLLAGEPAPVSHGEQVRDFLHVADVGGAFAALLDSDVAGPVNIGSGDGVPVRRIVELVGEETGAAELVRWGEVPLAPDDPPRIVADATRLGDEVGFAPRLTLEDGLRETVAWWREQG